MMFYQSKEKQMRAREKVYEDRRKQEKKNTARFQLTNIDNKKKHTHTHLYEENEESPVYQLFRIHCSELPSIFFLF